MLFGGLALAAILLERILVNRAAFPEAKPSQHHAGLGALVSRDRIPLDALFQSCIGVGLLYVPVGYQSSSIKR